MMVEGDLFFIEIPSLRHFFWGFSSPHIDSVNSINLNLCQI